MRKILGFLRRVYKYFRRQAFRIPGLSNYMYDLQNAESFVDRSIHEEMLADPERINTYRAGIERTVKKGDVVVDIGAGTGILSCFAARKADKVYAIEHSPIIETAKKICTDNRITNIQLIAGNSRNIKLARKADVIIHEQMGPGNPLSENMIENLLDARRRFLKPGGRIIPNKFDIFLEPVQLRDSHRVPFLWEFDIDSISYRSLRPLPESGTAKAVPITPYLRRFPHREAFEAYLCSPNPIMQFDLETVEASDFPGKVHYRNVAIRDGHVDGLWFYFNAGFDEQISLNTSPDGPPTHWPPTIYRLEQEKVRQGDILEYELDIRSLLDDSTWTLTWHGVRRHL